MDSKRQIGISLPVQEQLSIDAYQGLAVAAETLGYTHLSMGEIAGPEVFSVLGSLTRLTARIQIGTGVVPYNTRSTAYLAMAAATMDAMAPGRFFLGVGSSSPLIVEQWHGGTYDRPVAGFRAFMTSFEQFRRGAPTGVDGGTPMALVPRGAFDVPVWLAAIGPQMLREAGALAEGAYLAFCPIDEAPRRVDRVLDGARSVGRKRTDVDIVVSLNAYAGPHVDRARNRMSKFLETYAAVPTHRRGIDAAEWHGQEPSMSTPSHAEIDRICAVGDREDVARRVVEYWDAGVDVVFLHTLGLRKGDVHSALDTATGVAEVLFGRDKHHATGRLLEGSRAR